MKHDSAHSIVAEMAADSSESSSRPGFRSLGYGVHNQLSPKSDRLGTVALADQEQ